MPLRINPTTGQLDLVRSQSGSTAIGPICIPANTTLVIDIVPNASFSSIRYNITSGDAANNKARNLDYSIYNLNNIYNERKSNITDFNSPNWFFFVNDTAMTSFGGGSTFGGGTTFGGTGVGTGNLELTVTNNESFQICVTLDKLVLLF